MYSSKQGVGGEVVRRGGGDRLVNLMSEEGEERGNEVEGDWAEQGEDDEEGSDNVEFRVRGFISSNNYSGKKTTLILFINGEAVPTLGCKHVEPRNEQPFQRFHEDDSFSWPYFASPCCLCPSAILFFPFAPPPFPPCFLCSSSARSLPAPSACQMA